MGCAMEQLQHSGFVVSSCRRELVADMFRDRGSISNKPSLRPASAAAMIAKSTSSWLDPNHLSSVVANTLYNQFVVRLFLPVVPSH